MSPDPQQQLITAIARKLNETDPAPIAEIERIVAVLGPERAADLVLETLKIELAGGMLVRSGARRRTPGGVFFILARRSAGKAQRRKIWPTPYKPPHMAVPEVEITV